MEAEAEAAQDFEEGYINDSDPSVLRFLIASRWVRWSLATYRKVVPSVAAVQSALTQRFLRAYVLIYSFSSL